MPCTTKSENLLALLCRERTEVRVSPVDFALTLALSRKRAREKKGSEFSLASD